MALAPITHSSETIGAGYAPSLNAAFQELHDAFGFWPIVLAPYGGARTVAEQRVINPRQITSDHVKQRAVDIDNQRAFRNINQARFLAILAAHGWRNVQVNGAPFPAEPWHFANQSSSPAGGDATPIRNISEGLDMDIMWMVNSNSKSGTYKNGDFYSEANLGAPFVKVGNAEYQARAQILIGLGVSDTGHPLAFRYTIAGDEIEKLIAVRGVATKA